MLPPTVPFQLLKTSKRPKTIQKYIFANNIIWALLPYSALAQLISNKQNLFALNISFVVIKSTIPHFCVTFGKLTSWFDKENIKAKFQRRRKGKTRFNQGNLFHQKENQSNCQTETKLVDSKTQQYLIKFKKRSLDLHFCIIFLI